MLRTLMNQMEYDSIIINEFLYSSESKYFICLYLLGVSECDSCVHLLLDDVLILDHNITIISKDLDSVSVGVGAMRRLDNINRTVALLRVWTWSLSHTSLIQMYIYIPLIIRWPLKGY